MTDEHVNAIIAKLTEAENILKEIPVPDMDIAEWNATPIGRAMRRIADAIDMLVDA
jgi:hypothetical protein